MKAAYLYGIRDLRVEEADRPALGGQDEVLIRVLAVGVCGSDCHFYERGRIGKYVVKKPLILGHEASGEVVEVGSAVKHLKPGDQVAIEPGVPCRRCRFCKSGRYNLCAEEVVFMGTPPWDGAFREYVSWPADFVFRLPEGVSAEQAALVEPLAVGMQAVRRGSVGVGDSVAVLGCGPIGLVSLQCAAGAGATRLLATDVIPFRLEAARRLGAQAFDASAADSVNAVRDATGGGPDVVIETAGTVQTIQQSFRMVRPGGVVVLVGMPPEDEFAAPVLDIIMREYDVRGVFRYVNCFPPALALLAAGRIDTDLLITHRFPLEQAQAAIEFTLEHKETAIKVLVKPGASA